MIVASCVLLTLESPLDNPHAQKQTILYYSDMSITIIFIMEVFIKIFADGFLINGKNSYLRITLNMLDFIVVLFSVLSLIVNKKVLSIFKMLRVIRIIARNKGMKLALKTLAYALPNLLTVGVINFIFYLICAIFMLTFKKGELHYCYEKHLEEFPYMFDLVDNKFDCLNIGGEWVNEIRNYDSILNSLELVFSISIVNWI